MHRDSRVSIYIQNETLFTGTIPIPQLSNGKVMQLVGPLNKKVNKIKSMHVPDYFFRYSGGI